MVSDLEDEVTIMVEFAKIQNSMDKLVHSANALITFHPGLFDKYEKDRWVLRAIIESGTNNGTNRRRGE